MSFGHPILLRRSGLSQLSMYAISKTILLELMRHILSTTVQFEYSYWIACLNFKFLFECIEFVESFTFMFKKIRLALAREVVGENQYNMGST